MPNPAPKPSVNEPVNEPRPSPLSVSADLRWAIANDAPAEVIEWHRTELRCRRAERALRRALADAPPLRPEQVAFLRAVVNEYGGES